MPSGSGKAQDFDDQVVAGIFPMGYQSQKFSSRSGKSRPSASSRGEPSAQLGAVVTRLSDMFKDGTQYRRLLDLRGPEAQKLLDVFQSILDTPHDLDPTFRRNLVVAIQRLAKAAALYPSSYELDFVRLESTSPIAAGSFGDVYQGRYRGQMVCLKMIRLYQTSLADEFLKKFTREGVLWAQLFHPNVVSFYGFSRHYSRPCFVSPWMDNGDINTYLRKYPSSTRTLLIDDIAHGLEYLHFYGIIHGDLKGANILVDDTGRARLADFGISSVSDASILHWTSNSTVASRGGSIRWQAPELFDLYGDEEIQNTAASDVYAWGCVCYEVFTGNIPFHEILRDHTVIYKVKQAGIRPTRPPEDSPAWVEWGLTEDLWDLVIKSWNEQPSDRPTVAELISQLKSSIPQDNRRKSKEARSSARYRSGKRSLASLPSVAELDQILLGEEGRRD